MMPHQRKSLMGYFCALSHAINRQDLPRLHNPLIPYGLKQGKRVKNPRKNALFFLDTSILLSPMSKNKSYKISKLVSSTTIDYDTIPLHRYPTKPPSLLRVRAPSNSDVDFLLSQVSHSPFLRPLVLDFFSHFLPIASSVPTLTNKRHVVFNKTIRCFQQNDTSFFIKHHVFFPFI